MCGGVCVGGCVCVCVCVCVRMKYFPGPEQSRAVFIQYNTWIQLTTFHHNVQNCKHDHHHHHRDHSCMQLLQACTYTQTRECAFSLIILFTYCILPINGHKQENKSIKLTCCVLLASKFVDITEISLALFMEADAGWYNTEKTELSSRTYIQLCFVTWSKLIPNFPSLSLPILPLYSHMRPIFEHNRNHFFHLISANVFLLDPDSEGE